MLLLGLRIDGSVVAATPGGAGRFSAFLEITPTGAIRITTPSTELGQGIHSNLPRIVAEELDAAWADVEIVMPHADAAFVSPITGRHRTASSESVKIYYEQLRGVGAAAREMLCTAAAQRWGVSPGECLSDASVVRHPASGREATYASLAAAAAALPIPAKPRKKRPDEFKLIGKSIERKDLLDKVSGRTVFGIDVVAAGHAARGAAHAAAGRRRHRELRCRLRAEAAGCRRGGQGRWRRRCHRRHFLARAQGGRGAEGGIHAGPGGGPRHRGDPRRAACEAR